jgi:NADH dehydrogenase [ubiquinone] 1 alpha subcomplex assembly factor 7
MRSPKLVRLDLFMADANAAYYASNDPFSDFTTSPEISQVFGELLGAWAAVVWAQMGAPPRIQLIEAGPGRGSLMQDALRSIARVAPQFAQAAEVHFIENSARLRREQALRVPDARWHNSLEDVPAGKIILIANEFLDALPIRQFVRRESGWCERYVNGVTFAELTADLPALEAPIGAVIEVAEVACAWVAKLAQRIACEGGAALLMDYGKAKSGQGDSLQALRGGRPADPLCDPGSADLTAHVDFPALARVARAAGVFVWGPVRQGDFLNRLGLTERTAALAAANPAFADQVRDGSDRLSSPARMGNLFKAMCLTHPMLSAPPGFV